MQGTGKRSVRSCRSNCCLASIIYLFVLLLILFLLVFVAVPIIFKYCIEIQRNIIFATGYSENINYSDIKGFGINGVKNFYVTVDEVNNITLGCWQILPNELLNKFTENDDYNYENAITNNKFNTIIYLHGNGGIRSQPLELYSILRKTFNIISCDYRGYADSSKGELNETTIVNDTVNLYLWIRNQTTSNIFFWGHSLGTGVSTHTISNLKNFYNETPTGLVLEAPFSSVTDVVELNIVAKVFSWLPWFKWSLVDPFIDHDFDFNSKKYIVDVDCPIMIIHAKDDEVIPYQLATRLYEVAVQNRNYTYQGNVTYYLFESKGYMHMNLYLAPELPTYIKNFTKECVEFQNQTIATFL